MATDFEGAIMRVQGGSMTMSQIASFMEGFAMPERRPIVDRTGLTGRYDVDLKFTIYSGLTVDDSTLKEPLLKEAMEDYLGLRLESRRETRQALVIDRVTMPAPD